MEGDSKVIVFFEPSSNERNSKINSSISLQSHIIALKMTADNNFPVSSVEWNEHVEKT